MEIILRIFSVCNSDSINELGEYLTKYMQTEFGPFFGLKPVSVLHLHMQTADDYDDYVL